MYLYILNYVTIFNQTSNYIKKKHKKKMTYPSLIGLDFLFLKSYI
jgi:hypothetical protein